MILVPAQRELADSCNPTYQVVAVGSSFDKMDNHVSHHDEETYIQTLSLHHLLIDVESMSVKMACQCERASPIQMLLSQT